MATRRIIPGLDFPGSLAALGSPTAERMVRELAERIAQRPDCGTALDGSDFHVVHTRSYGDYPALRIYYKYDQVAIYLLAVDRYDELAEARD